METISDQLESITNDNKKLHNAVNKTSNVNFQFPFKFGINNAINIAYNDIPKLAVIISGIKSDEIAPINVPTFHDKYETVINPKKYHMVFFYFELEQRLQTIHQLHQN